MDSIEPKGTLSLWESETSSSKFPPLKQDITADICIIGGGIAGLTTAYCLLQNGFSVVLLDKDRIGFGDTGRTTAHLTSVLDARYSELIKRHGLKTTKLVAQSHMKAIDFIESLVKKEKISCQFERVDGYLCLSPKDDLKSLEKELKAAKEIGLNVDLMKGFKLGSALRFPHQAQFHPLEYLRGLAKLIHKKGGNIFEHTPAINIKMGKKIKVQTTNKSTITANKLIICTHEAIYDPQELYKKQNPHRTYVIGAHVPKGSIKQALYWDTLNPYHYVRLYAQPGSHKDILIVGGEDHRTGTLPQGRPFDELEKWTRNTFSNVEDIVFKWSGQVLEPIDSLAFIGSMGDNIYGVTGESGNGMTYGTIAGLLLSDLIMGKDNPWEKIYDPSRPMPAPKKSTKHPHHPSPEEISSENDVVSGSGGVLTCGLKKLCVYRDPQGKVIKRSAYCTHMGVVVSWNPIEKSWDCPAHGSRFSADGEILNGPAKDALKALTKN